VKIALTTKLIRLVYEWEFNTARLGEGSGNYPTSKPSTSWSKGGSRKQSCNSVADQNRSLPKSPVPLSEAILECEFLKKFTTLAFDYYSRASDPVQHIKHFRDKIVIYSRNDPLLCLTIPSGLKGVTSDWFYSLSSRSLYNFKEITESFLTQYASYREAKKNNHHLLTVKIKQGDKLKSYIGCFQNQLARFSIAVKMSLHSCLSADCRYLTLYTSIF